MQRMGVAAVVAVSLLAAGCASMPGSGIASGSQGIRGSCTESAIGGELYARGVLTVATDMPAYPPWFEDNDPGNGRGYESAVAYEVATHLGFKGPEVRWVYEPFGESYAPGRKDFDFDIDEISYSAQRARAVTFSDSYYDVRQALVALMNSPITTRHTPAELRTYVYGDQAGTTGLAFIDGRIRPTRAPKAYRSLTDAERALQDKKIAALVIDAPIAQYIVPEVPGAIVVAQFPPTGEHYGLLLGKGNKLVACVNKALAAMRGNGTLARLQAQWLRIRTSIPTIQP
jgi:polar amino acid transport system substrate-binding protein